jgi:hypothetical protein
MIIGTASTDSTIKGLVRKGDVLAADGENGFEGVSVYKWLINLGVTYSIILYRFNYISFTRKTLILLLFIHIVY